MENVVTVGYFSCVYLFGSQRDISLKIIFIWYQSFPEEKANVEYDKRPRIPEMTTTDRNVVKARTYENVVCG
jgi:hypothetical protein